MLVLVAALACSLSVRGLKQHQRRGVAAAIALSLCVAAAPAAASTGSEERQGAALVKMLNSGKRSCKSLAPADFERIGEYAMGLNFIGSDQHAAMNRRMRTMMGGQGEERAHQAMGRAFSGCVTRGQQGRLGVGAMGGYGSSGAMMGVGAYGPGMMNVDGRAAVRDGTRPWAVVLIALLAGGLGAALSAFISPRLRRRRPTANTS